MRRIGPILAALSVLFAAACSLTPQPTETPIPPTATTIPTATATITPIAAAASGTPSMLPTPTPDPRDPTHAPGTLRTNTWPVGTAAIASLSANTFDVDTAAVVLTVPVPQGTDLAFYFAVPPSRDYAGFVTFPVSPAVMMLQPGDTIRLIGRAAGTVPLPPIQGSGAIVNVIGVRFVRGDMPLRSP